MADKVILDIKKGKATIKGGENTLLGKLLKAKKGKIKIKSPRLKGREIEVEV